MAISTEKKRTYVLLHGLGGKGKPNDDGVDTWLNDLAAELIAAGHTVIYPNLVRPKNPNLQKWVADIVNILKGLPHWKDVTIIGFSLGAVALMRALARLRSQSFVADRIIFVSPCYISPGMVPGGMPPCVRDFIPPSKAQAGWIRTAVGGGGKTWMICGENDFYGGEDHFAAFAERLGAELYILDGARHVSLGSGYGPWRWMKAFCEYLTYVPPQGKDWRERD